MTHPAKAPALRYFRILSIAGSDSGGGAGVQADLKTVSALGCYGMTAITALTAQNTLGVTAIHPVPADHLRAELDAVGSDIGVDAVKVGMLAGAETVRVVATAIDHFGWAHVVVDPVMVSTSGSRLMAPATLPLLVSELFPRATVITPNLDEAEWLLGARIRESEDFAAAAQALQRMGAKAVLLKGGHLGGEELTDLLLTAEGSLHRFSGPRIESRHLHGTGCTLSAAMACQLALGLPLPDAVAAAWTYVRRAISAGASAQLGQGHGPLNHGHAPIPTRWAEDGVTGGGSGGFRQTVE
jgi:hydroxymethylpyrimidine/phosphomethylpyrimidine kinase